MEFIVRYGLSGKIRLGRVIGGPDSRLLWLCGQWCRGCGRLGWTGHIRGITQCKMLFL